MTRLLTLAFLTFLLALPAGLGCDKGDKDDGKAEKMGAEIDEASEDIKDAANDIEEDVKDAANDIEEDLKDKD